MSRYTVGESRTAKETCANKRCGREFTPRAGNTKNARQRFCSVPCRCEGHRAERHREIQRERSQRRSA